MLVYPPKRLQPDSTQDPNSTSSPVEAERRDYPTEAEGRRWGFLPHLARSVEVGGSLCASIGGRGPLKGEASSF